MEQARARRIMRLLGWGPTLTAKRYNDTAKTKMRPQDISAQVTGSRRVSDGLAIFLRMSVRVAVLQRRLDPEGCRRTASERVRKPRKPV